MRLRSLAAAALIAALTAPAAPARSQDLGALAGFLGGGGAPVDLSPTIFGAPTPVRIWLRPSAGPEGWLRVEGRAQAPQARVHLERGLKQELALRTRGALHVEGVALSQLSADARAFHLAGEIRHAPRPGGRVESSGFEARIPYAVTPQGLKLRPEGRLGAAPPALRAAVEALLQPVDLVAEEALQGTRLESFVPSVSAQGDLEARAALLASPQALTNFWALALGGARGR
ncbi:hypothetical protein [Neomegalonema sp.]|uniref:hypothetical protein n=1 Tax=Neomegalonema sp. TaxID=2039713 RepID=UPI0026051822|nr:hypothetical protein [Neomegalonema sp.]MDD2869515.1 hypothetical protein [Neomegalonema sp.]